MQGGAWKRALQSVQAVLEDDDSRHLLDALRPLGRDGDVFVAEAPDRAVAHLAEKRCARLLDQALAKHTKGTVRRVSITVARNGQQELFPAPQPIGRPNQKSRDRAALQDRYTFDNFIVGASNQFAHAASLAVSQQPGDTYNPLFIYGGVGLGKTHLVCAIGNRVLDENPKKRVVYLSADSFMNELITSLRRHQMEDLKRKFRRVDYLILDDVQFLAGRERTQEEFFHTFNSLYESRKQIILTSDKFPKEIQGLEERLRNRFESGLIADIQPPDIETRIAILEKRVEGMGLQLEPDVAVFIAETFDSNVRELEGSLTRLAAHASLHGDGSLIRLDLAREALHSFVANRPKREISIESIQNAVSDYFHLHRDDLLSKSRTRHITHPRQIAMYLCRRHTDASFPVIGDRFGGRDHSTVIHATQVIERRMQHEPKLRETIERLAERLRVSE